MRVRTPALTDGLLDLLGAPLRNRAGGSTSDAMEADILRQVEDYFDQLEQDLDDAAADEPLWETVRTTSLSEELGEEMGEDAISLEWPYSH